MTAGNRGIDHSFGCCGKIYKLTLANGRWSVSVLCTFKGGSADGSMPLSIVLDKLQNIYGTTYAGGGTGCQGPGCGTVFKLTHSPGGWTEPVLYRFSGGKDGAQPAYDGGLVIDASHNV